MDMLNCNGLNIERNINLAEMTTMKLGGPADFFARVKNLHDVSSALKFAQENGLNIFILGGGSNTLVHDRGFNGLVIKNEIMGKEIIEEDEFGAVIKIGAGENWDKFVRWAVREKNLSGCEMMVMIPGSVGALPVQNVGAYGQETKDIFVELEAVNLETGEVEILSKEDCNFGYRDSIFRSSGMGKYLIISVTLKLGRELPVPPFYISVEEYISKNNINYSDLNTKKLMDIVVKIRSFKLPDPDEIPSAGSFFKNAIIDKEKAEWLISNFGDNVPIFPHNNKFKVATGWLIDKAGLKGETLYGMRIHPENALILTNISASSFNDLVKARTKIQKIIEEKFGIKIEQEPLEI